MKVLLVFLLGFSLLPAVVNAQEAAGTAGAVMDPSALPGMTGEEATPAAPAAEETAAAEAATSEAAPAEEAAPREAENGVYQVRQGDTLWDLASSFLKSPYDWPRIWEFNKSEIPNPDLIYPDQKFRIPGVDYVMPPSEEAPAVEAPSEEPEAAAAAEPEAEPAAEESAEASAEEAAAEPEAEAGPPTKKVEASPSKTAAIDSMVVDKKWRGDGQIISDVGKKIMISQGDLIYVNIGAAKGVKPRMRADVYRKGQMVREYETGEKVGQVMKRVAVIEMTQEVQDQTSVAVVITSYEPIKLGDFVKLKN